MNSVTKYVLGIVALAGAIFFSWYFFSVIVYILVAAVISRQADYRFIRPGEDPGLSFA